jgi:hypothetical protein
MSALPGGRSATQGYYQSGFSTVRQTGQTPVIFHDGFANPNSWNGFLTGQGSNGAIVDHHEYQVFSNGDVAMSPEQHVAQVSQRANGWASGVDKFLICGEWTGAMTDCAPALVRLLSSLLCLSPPFFHAVLVLDFPLRGSPKGESRGCKTRHDMARSRSRLEGLGLGPGRERVTNERDRTATA